MNLQRELGKIKTATGKILACGHRGQGLQKAQRHMIDAKAIRKKLTDQGLTDWPTADTLLATAAEHIEALKERQQMARTRAQCKKESVH